MAIVLEPTADLAAEGPASSGLLRYLRPILGQSRLLRRILATSALLRVFALAIPGLTAVLFASSNTPAIVDTLARRSSLA